MLLFAHTAHEHSALITFRCDAIAGAAQERIRANLAVEIVTIDSAQRWWVRVEV